MKKTTNTEGSCTNFMFLHIRNQFTRYTTVYLFPGWQNTMICSPQGGHDSHCVLITAHILYPQAASFWFHQLNMSR